MCNYLFQCEIVHFEVNCFVECTIIRRRYVNYKTFRLNNIRCFKFEFICRIDDNLNIFVHIDLYPTVN